MARASTSGSCTTNSIVAAKALSSSASRPLLKTYGLTTWSDSAYAGPELVLGVVPLKVTAAVMFNLADRSDVHPQFGIGFGFLSGPRDDRPAGRRYLRP